MLDCVHSRLLAADFQHRPYIEGSIDLAIGTASNNPIKLSREFLFRDEICGIVRSGHPKYKKKISLKELANNFEHIGYYIKGERPPSLTTCWPTMDCSVTARSLFPTCRD